MTKEEIFADQMLRGTRMTKEVMKLALQYIEANAETKDECEIAEGLRQIIAEADKQNEPVAWGYKGKDGLILDVICPEEHEREEGGYTIPLYTTPQQRKWVVLSEKDADSIECWFREEIENNRFSVQNLIAHIEAKLKEKNGY
jgi:hypothetical protein